VVGSVSILNRSKEAQEKYWSDRAIRVVEAGEKSAEEMTADLAKLYREAQKAIQKEKRPIMSRFRLPHIPLCLRADNPTANRFFLLSPL